MESGADIYLEKPFEIEDLLTHIKEVLKQVAI
jgi:DNA-binding response OmpR family regulator